MRRNAAADRRLCGGSVLFFVFEVIFLDNKKPVASGFKLPAGTVKILDLMADELSVSRATLCKTIVLKYLVAGISFEHSPCLDKSVLVDLLRSGSFDFSELPAGFVSLSARNDTLN